MTEGRMGFVEQHRRPHKTERINTLDVGSPGQRGNIHKVFDDFHIGLLRAFSRAIAPQFRCDPHWSHFGMAWEITAPHDGVDGDLTLAYRINLKHRVVSTAVDRRAYAFSLQVRWVSIEPSTLWRFSSLIRKGYCARDRTVLRYDSLHPDEVVFYDTEWPDWFGAIWSDVRRMQPSRLEIDLAQGEMTPETRDDLRALLLQWSTPDQSEEDDAQLGFFPPMPAPGFHVAQLSSQVTTTTVMTVTGVQRAQGVSVVNGDVSLGTRQEEGDFPVDPLAELIGACDLADRRIAETRTAIVQAYRVAEADLQSLTLFDLKSPDDQLQTALAWAQAGWTYKAPSESMLADEIAQKVADAKERLATYERDQQEAQIRRQALQACCRVLGHYFHIAADGTGMCQRCAYLASQQEVQELTQVSVAPSFSQLPGSLDEPLIAPPSPTNPSPAQRLPAPTGKWIN